MLTEIMEVAIHLHLDGLSLGDPVSVLDNLAFLVPCQSSTTG